MRDYRVCFPPDLNAGMRQAAHDTTINDLCALGLFDLRPSTALVERIARRRPAAD